MRATLCTALVLMGACNKAPEGLSIRVEPSAPTTEDVLTAIVVDAAIDPNDDPVQLRWSWTLDGAPYGDELEVPAADTLRGQIWRLTAVASDGELDGEPVSASVTIVNTPPRATVSLSPAAPRTSDALNSEVVTEDPDGDEVTVRWSWQRDDGSVDLDQALIPADQTARGESWIALATLDDGIDTSGPFASEPVMVGNTPPLLASAALVPTPVVEASELSCVPQGWFDADDDPLDAPVTWSVNGVDLEEIPVLTGASFSRGDTVFCSLLPRDSYSRGEAVSSAPEVVKNTAPSLLTVTISPADPTAADALGYEVAGVVDDDGDEVALDVQWFVDGVVVATTEALTGLAKDQSVQVVVTPRDDADAGAPVTSSTVIIANTPPVVTSVIAGPLTASVEDEARATVVAEDLDDDPITLTYAWSSGSKTLGTGPTQSLATLARGDSVVVTVTPSDGADTGLGVASASLVVANAPPKIVALSVSPAKPKATDTISAVVSYSDSDGDTVTGEFEWSVNGTVVSTASSVTGGTDFKGGDVVTVTVVPDDGLDTGVPSSVTVAVPGSRPTRPRAVIKPRYPKVGDTIQCVVDVPSVDPDGKSVAHLVSWENKTNRWHTYKVSTTTLKGDTIDGAYVAGGHQWSCYMYAFDGSEYSPGDYAYADVRAAGALRLEQADGVAWGTLAQSLASVGDVDKDKVADIAVGDWRTTSNGAVHIVSGDLSGTNEFADEVLYTLKGHAGFDRAGRAVLGGLDFDSDGDDDLIISAEGAKVDSKMFGQGVVYLVPAPFKSGDVDTLAKVRISGKSKGSGIGNTLREADLDGDGTWELVTASEVEDVGSFSDAGEIYIMESPFTKDLSVSKAATTIQGDATDARCGIYWDIGDHNGDGDDDLLSYAFLKFKYGSDSGTGQLHLFDGPLSSGTLKLTADSDAVIYPENGAVWGGAHVRFEDYDDDGYDDLLLGLPSNTSTGGVYAGRLYLVLGDSKTKTSSLSSADMTIDGAYRSMGFGDPSFADVDGSGDPDLVVRNNGRYYKGNIHVFYDLGSSGTFDSDDADVVLNGGLSLLLQDMDADGMTDIWTSLMQDDLREDRKPGVGLLGLYLGDSL